MPSQSMNKANLKHFDYHWFWGLRYHQKEIANNLSAHVDEWVSNDELARDIRQKQTRIDHYYFRIVYWLFNIKNYASDFYRLQAYAIYIENKDNDMRQDNNGQTDISTTLNACFNNSLWAIAYPFKTTANAISSLCNVRPNPIPEPVEEKNESDDFFIITEPMQPHLAIIGWSVANRETLSWQSIRQSYKAKSWLLHPDKGGTADEFANLASAVECLEQLVSGATHNDPTRTSSDFFQKEWARMQELFARTEKIRQSHEKIRQSHEKIRQSHEKIRQSHEEIRQSHKEIKLKLQFFIYMVNVIPSLQCLEPVLRYQRLIPGPIPKLSIPRGPYPSFFPKLNDDPKPLVIHKKEPLLMITSSCIN